MKRLFVSGTVLAGALLLALTPSSVLATCTGIDQGLYQALGGFFQNCPDARPVKGFAYALGNFSTINSDSVDMVCEDNTGSNGQLSPCNPEAGQAGDGNVTVQFDWGSSGNILGCPNPTRANGVGRNLLQVVANDGSSAFVSVGYSPDLGAYIVDFAEVPGGASGSLPLSCARMDADGGLNVTSLDATNLCVKMNPCAMHSDCDANTWGVTGGPIGFTPTCITTQVPQCNPGKLYKRDAPCTTVPDDTFTTLGTAWTLIGSPDAAGNLCVPTPRPVDPTQCAFVAGSGMIHDPASNTDTETLATTGIPLPVAGQNAPSARALDVRAVQAGGNIVVSFRTAAELDLVGFNVLTDTKGGKDRLKVNDALIAAKGKDGAGASYQVTLARGKFQGGKVVYVQSMLKSGNSLLSDPAKF